MLAEGLSLAQHFLQLSSHIGAVLNQKKITEENMPRIRFTIPMILDINSFKGN
jgi:DNA-directed RNA polymerase subunit H (RpoH/RPB5)